MRDLVTVHVLVVENPEGSEPHVFAARSEGELEEILADFYEGQWEDAYETTKDFLRERGLHPSIHQI